ncbi:MAG TPA: trypsin-like peptidase domain-containing protein [Pyrinomonadaceae bacterium]|nr:trypsin-like peptidase domain-containing protein [Pyrinomonadaceae bacterium]
MKIRSRLVFLPSLLMMVVYTATPAQQLRDAFRKVNQSVVTVRTKRVDLTHAPGQVMSIIDGLGSGVLISNDGKVLTAAHVVQTADAALVEFPDGQNSIARVIASDVRADVALLQLQQPPKNISPAALGDSDKVEVGDQIFVIGAPYGISQTLTAGHVSGRRRVDKEGETQPYIELLQTDAAVNGGNSGSPMFDMNGQVVGIVSTIMSQSGGSEGLAFATASNTTKRFLLDRKPFWSGIDGVLVTGDLAKALNLPQPAGFLVQRIGEGSIGSRLGINGGNLQVTIQGADVLLGGDVILSVNDIDVTVSLAVESVALAQGDNYDRIFNSMSSLKPGDPVVLKVLRAGKVMKLTTTIEP